ncbi:hypothetical protein KGQ19_25310 [Catenulispora sp. NL8]|uniref:Uncharacterized protein n=1 Tax=Catenulispora pinistramenti TaxID=2705254 RepID=A0ABS5KVU5_9ACTN|nr:hypothetical protein [Catenulispora pinistramenti]MBS2550191.1 hypothetical protein [Catenulispora pinistramenti]
MSSVFSGPTAKDLAWLVPPGAHVPDGRMVSGALLADMIAEWHRIVGGSVSVSRLKRKWASLGDDPMTLGSSRPEGEGHDVAAVLNHALGRAVTAGLKDPHDGGNTPGNSYLCATLIQEDTAAVLLAILDRHLTGGAELAAWYLASPCDVRNCLHHGDDRGPEVPGSGVEPLDYKALPRLYWYPRLGTVEIHPWAWDTLAPMPAEERRPIRVPMPALVPPGVFKSNSVSR